MTEMIQAADRASSNGPIDGASANADSTRQRNNILSKISDAKALIIITFVFNAGMAAAYFLAGGSANAAQTRQNTSDIADMRRDNSNTASRLSAMDTKLNDIVDFSKDLRADVRTLLNRPPGGGPPRMQ